MNTLEVSNLSVKYNEAEIVKNVSFKLHKGSLCALLGANAAGKTTLLKGICSLIRHTGHSSIEGKELSGMNERQIAQYISYIPQRCSLDIPISVLEVVLMGFTSTLSMFEGISPAQKEKALEALERVGISKLAQKLFINLSEGQKQLVIIARALVQENSMMIFDEPDSALDFQNKHIVLSIIKEIVGQEKSALVCLHDANIALKYCTHAILLKDGEIVQEIDLKNIDAQSLKLSLSMIYGSIEIVEYNGNYIMIK